MLLIAPAVLAFACAAPSGPTPVACTGDDRCGPNARCVGTACVENTPPVAEFTWSGDLVASAQIDLDASASHDGDTGDGIVYHRWEATSSDAACAKPDISSSARTVSVRFGCAGHWDVKLVVYDGKYVESAPVTHTLTVSERTGPAIVSAGDDQTVAHTCSGTPLRCTTATTVHLSATLDPQAAVGVRWSVQPPAGRELNASRRVRFVPDATALAPEVVIETDGTAISGDWVFLAEALSGTEVLASDITRVSVGNQPPVASGQGADVYPHTYLAESQFFAVSASIPVSVTDPDGDPVVRNVTVHHTGDGGSVFQTTDGESAIAFSILVPRANPLWLIGGPDLARSIELQASDVNGGSAQLTFPVVVGNNMPRARVYGGSAPHSFNATTKRYLASVSAGFWIDADGDPLDHEVTMTDAAAADCATSSLLGSGEIKVNCQRTWKSNADLATFITPRTAQVVVADPWKAWSGNVTLRITNRAPVASSSLSRSLKVSCSTGNGTGFCGGGGSGTPPRTNTFAVITSTATLSGLSDPDGDPIQVVPGPTGSGFAGSSCSGDRACTLRYTLGGGDFCGDVPSSTTIPFTASDGVSPVSLSLSVQPSC